ncbi:hypothetical protein PHMEG_0008945 [Phytophthora megakarya]|uniref:CCHC-type domain-containing protein n=1 Tax=Phytophthora megakarya TaxID=4795 RepID=A0A225WHW8_9STRA|nr:hypothetical protein PHMEG_0008945 [Phytophthora megakarya]
MYFLRGLPLRVREEVQYRRSATFTDAITVALDYERSHSQRSSDGARDRTRYRSYDHKRSKGNDDRPVSMGIDHVTVSSKEECMRRNLCFRCGSSAHLARNCPEQPEQQQMTRRSAPRYTNSGNVQGRGNARMNMVHEDGKDVNTIVMDRVTMNVVDIQEQADELQDAIERMREEVEKTFTAVLKTTKEADSVKVNAVKANSKSFIFIKKGRVNVEYVRILLDTGVSTNMIKLGLASAVLLSRRFQAQRFDGTLTPPTDVKHVEAPVSMGEYFFPTMEFVEWKLSESHDVIFGNRSLRSLTLK